MEVEDISQAYMGHSYSCNNAFEKPEEQDPAICRASDDTAPATSITGCFDCSICLDLVVDPVVTLCGHLFCWPCIYKWMQVESMPHHQCPVCKAFISQDTVIPLYGRGRAGDRGAKADPNVPERPPLQLHHNDAVAPSVHPHQFHHHRNSDFNNDLPYPPPSVIASLFHSTAGGLVGGLAISMLPWVQRHDDGLTTYYARPYFLTSSESNPRLMRRQMRVENLLHQIWIFLLCFIVMCLLFF